MACRRKHWVQLRRDDPRCPYLRAMGPGWLAVDSAPSPADLDPSGRAECRLDMGAFGPTDRIALARKLARALGGTFDGAFAFGAPIPPDRVACTLSSRKRPPAWVVGEPPEAGRS